MLVPRPAPRKVILGHVARIAGEKEARTIHLHGSDQGLSQAFVRDLAEETGGTADVKELQVSLQPTKHTKNAATTKVLLVQGNTTKQDADVVVDITSAERPRLLHPCIERYTLNPFRYRLKTRHIPLARYAFQVALFLLISLLNNAAFAYHVPMAVHIIFRSGGLVVNMLLGWLLKKRRYALSSPLNDDRSSLRKVYKTPGFLSLSGDDRCAPDDNVFHAVEAWPQPSLLGSVRSARDKLWKVCNWH